MPHCHPLFCLSRYSVYWLTNLPSLIGNKASAARDGIWRGSFTANRILQPYTEVHVHRNQQHLRTLDFPIRAPHSAVQIPSYFGMYIYLVEHNGFTESVVHIEGGGGGGGGGRTGIRLPELGQNMCTNEYHHKKYFTFIPCHTLLTVSPHPQKTPTWKRIVYATLRMIHPFAILLF